MWELLIQFTSHYHVGFELRQRFTSVGKTFQGCKHFWENFNRHELVLLRKVLNFWSFSSGCLHYQGKTRQVGLVEYKMIPHIARASDLEFLPPPPFEILTLPVKTTTTFLSTHEYSQKSSSPAMSSHFKSFHLSHLSCESIIEELSEAPWKFFHPNVFWHYFAILLLRSRYLWFQINKCVYGDDV